jgi:hypothetical protein
MFQTMMTHGIGQKSGNHVDTVTPLRYNENMKAHSVNDLDNFIGGWYIDPKICDDLIKYYEESPNKYRGFVGKPNESSHTEFSRQISAETKRSTEVVLDLNSKMGTTYLDAVQEVLEQYMIKYPYSNAYCRFTITSGVQIQHYIPTEGFYEYHTERTTAKDGVTRHLVFMTYLNDVSNGGTEFYHQKLITPAEKGLTLIWPVDWTFTHRGVISPDQEKYITTGWYDFF